MWKDDGTFRTKRTHCRLSSVLRVVDSTVDHRFRRSIKQIFNVLL